MEKRWRGLVHVTVVAENGRIYRTILHQAIGRDEDGGVILRGMDSTQKMVFNTGRIYAEKGRC